MKKRLFVLVAAFLLFLGLSTVNVFAEEKSPNFEVIKLVDNGDDYNKLVFVIMGDGYTEKELLKFKSDAGKLVDGILKEEPYNKYKKDINFYIINVISNMSGASPNPNEIRDTYFGSCFNFSYGIQRLLAPTKANKAYECLDNIKIDYDKAIILVNSDIYGGSGGDISVASTNEKSVEICLHELGHSFAKLDDEYFAGDMYTKEAVNVTRESNPTLVKWKSFIGKDNIGVFAMQDTNGWYIPHESCKMKVLDSSFCAVCKTELEKKIVEQTIKPKPVPTITASKTNMTNINVTIAIEYPRYSVTNKYSTDEGKSWKDYESPIIFVANGSVKAKFQDNKGNWSAISSYTVSNIDKTAPKIGGIINQKFYNSDLTISFNEGTAKLNGVNAKNGDRVSKDGAYTLLVTDNAGNSTRTSFYIDKTPPVIRAKQINGSPVVSGGSYKTSGVKVDIIEANVYSRGATLNGRSILVQATGMYKAKGDYVITVVDRAGNKNIFKFTIK